MVSGLKFLNVHKVKCTDNKVNVEKYIQSIMQAQRNIKNNLGESWHLGGVGSLVVLIPKPLKDVQELS